MNRDSKELLYYKYQKPGHYANTYPLKKKEGKLSKKKSDEDLDLQIKERRGLGII